MQRITLIVARTLLPTGTSDENSPRNPRAIWVFRSGKEGPAGSCTTDHEFHAKYIEIWIVLEAYPASEKLKGITSNGILG